MLSFSSEQNPIVQVKIGLSSVSIDGALRNLDAENPDWDFAALRKKHSRPGMIIWGGSR